MLQWIPPDRFCEINQMVYPLLIQERRGAWGFVAEAFWAEVGTHRTYLQAHRDFLIRNAFGVVNQSPVSPRVQLIPPVLIGGGCEFGDEAQIGPMAILGQRCRIGKEAVIEDSVLLEKVTVGSGTHVRGCIIGRETAVDPGIHVEDMVASGGEWKKIG